MPRRVLVVTPWGERLGGAEEMLWLGLTHLDRSRWEPAVAFLGDGPFVGEIASAGIATELVPAGRLRQPRAVLGAARRLRAVIRRRRPDLLLSWSAKAHLYGAAAAAGIDGPRVVWWQHTDPDGHWLERLATALPADAIGCSSAAGRRSQAELWPTRRLFVVNPGIVVGNDSPDRNPGLRTELGIPAADVVVGIVGRLQPNKGQDRFLRALAVLRDRGHRLHGLVVGGDAHELSPEYVPLLEGLVSELDLDGQVTMTGQVDDARPYLEAMDIAVNASEQESFPLTVMEAMAAGAPVVTAARDGRREIVADGVDGVLTRGLDPVELADGIESLLIDPENRRRIAKQARRASEERFSAQRMADELASRLDEVVDV
jgi:glycosyltransferase involved in cell wall biosynthesis